MMTFEPLTDEEIDALLPTDGALAWPAVAWATFSITAGQECVFGCGGRAPRLGRERSGDEGHRPACPFVRLVAEVRRLRSDEWLRAAMEEFGLPSGADPVARQHFADVVMPILQKHRDGKE